MKTCLNKEQSRHLIKLGLKIPMHYIAIHDGSTIKDIDGIDIENPNGWYVRINLTDLLEILPKEIKSGYFNCNLTMSYGCDMPEQEHYIWFTYYDELNDMSPKFGKELIDALYELLVWTIENGYLKFE